MNAVRLGPRRGRGPAGETDAGSPSRIALVGAGPVGATFALALSRAGFPVHVVERRHAPVPDRPPIALSFGSRRMLEALGLWSRVAPHATPIARIHVSQRGGFGAVRMSAAESEVEALGYVVAPCALARVFDDALAAAGGVRLLAPAAVEHLTRTACGVRLGLRTAPGGEPSALEASVAVAAGGGGIPRCEPPPGTVEVREYPQAALGAVVRAECGHGSLAYERFTPEGPLALLPMSDRRCALVWTLAPERAGTLLRVGERAFLAELHRSFGDRLGRFEEVSGRALFPLRRVRARTSPRSRLFLIGSAATVLHPVAGQGLNLGLRDAADLAEVLADALRAGADPGGPACFERFEARRRRDRDRLCRGTDLLARVFLPELRPLATLRGAALVGLDLLTPAKRRFARHAMGLALPQSRLVRGLPV